MNIGNARRKHPSERRIVDVLIRHIRKTHRVTRELPVYERSVDIAAVCFETNELWTIEAKISDWSRALSQAIVNLAAGERSFIAIHAKHVHTVKLGLLAHHGIGLIAVGTKWDDVQILNTPRRSPYVNSLVVGRIKDRLMQ